MVLWYGSHLRLRESHSEVGGDLAGGIESNILTIAGNESLQNGLWYTRTGSDRVDTQIAILDRFE